MKVADLIKSQNKQVVILDFDGTIGNLVIDWTVWFQAMRQFLKLSEKKFDWQTITKLQNKLALAKPDSWVQEITDYNYFYEKTHTEDFYLLPDTEKLIRLLTDAKLDLYIWSCNDSRNIQEFLNQKKLAKKFKKIIGRDSCKFLKPSADGFNLIWDRKISKKDYLFIGDQEIDAEAAKAAGIDFIYRGDIN